MQEGYIKLYRCILDCSWSKQPDFVAVWVYCLLRANYNPAEIVTRGGSAVHLEPGQFITSREQISLQTGVQESKVERILKVFKSEQQIEQENKGKFRVISITNWNKYQGREQQIEQQTNSKRTANEHKQEGKEGKEKNKEGAKRFCPPTLEEVSVYCTERNRGVNPNKWHDHYTAKNWMIGKNKMRDWKAAVRTWEQDTPASVPQKTAQERFLEAF